MRYEFTKMQSLGNDFIVLDGIRRPINLAADIAKRLADRHFGIGCDQVLLIRTYDKHNGRRDEFAPDEFTQDQFPTGEFELVIFNADGSQTEQCGNGARCIARFLNDNKLSGRTIRLHTASQDMHISIGNDELVEVEMGIPQFSPPQIPFIADQPATTYLLELPTNSIEICPVNIGNPHAVQIVSDVATAAVNEQGPLIEHHTRFPARVNAGFMQIISPNYIKLRVYERGAGETLGCGSGACAAVAAGILLNKLHSQVTVELPGGQVYVRWAGLDTPIYLRGGAHRVFTGTIEL